MLFKKEDSRISKPYSYEELKAEWAAEDAWMEAHPVKAFFINLYRDVRRFILNAPELPRDGYRKVKRGIQRAYRGWADEDVWSLHHYQAKVIYEMLLKMKETKHGYAIVLDAPKDGNFSDEWYDKNDKEWTKIIDKIIYAFKLNVDVANGDRECYVPDSPRISKLRKEFMFLTQREECDRLLGMSLYAKYFFNLWD